MTTETFAWLVTFMLRGRSDLDVSNPEPSGNVTGAKTITVGDKDGAVFEIEIVGPEKEENR